MATRAAKAERDALVRKRLDAAVVALAERLNVAVPLPAEFVRDAELARTIEQERLADLLESVVARGDDLLTERGLFIEQAQSAVRAASDIKAECGALCEQVRTLTSERDALRSTESEEDVTDGGPDAAARGHRQRANQRPAQRDA